MKTPCCDNFSRQSSLRNCVADKVHKLAVFGAELRQQALYAPNADDELARFICTSSKLGFDLGQPWGGQGEVRLGLSHTLWRLRPRLLGTDYRGSTETIGTHETGIRLRTVVDQLDFANFPQTGRCISA